MDTLESLFLDLVSIPSPSGKEKRVAEYIRNFLIPLSYQVEEDSIAEDKDGSGNLLVRFLPHKNKMKNMNANVAEVRDEGIDKGASKPDTQASGKAQTWAGELGKPVVFLVAHIDTVPVPYTDTIPIKVESGIVHSGGSCALGADDKAGVALALYLLEQAAQNPESFPPFEVVFTVREEQGCAGAKAFDPSRLNAPYGICLDGESPVGTTILEAPTKLKYTLTLQGKSSHAALNPQQGINAIKGAGELLSGLPTGLLDAFTTANIGMIQGGTSINVVPEICYITGELRSLRKENLQSWKKYIEHRVSTLSNLKYSLKWEEMYEGYRVSLDAPHLQAFTQACKKEGVEVSFLSSRGGGDANFFNAKGFPTYVFGLGMEEIHSPQERYQLSNLTTASRILKSLLKML
ncbi:MAG: M20/M25/M40 family metallo-hydrolase [Spirochaetales bacterium]